MKTILAAAFAAVLSGCAVGPDFKAPAPPQASLVAAHPSDAAPLSDRLPDGLWWRQFDDAELDSLMTRALDSNLDLTMAIDRVRASRAAFTGAELDYGPHVPLTAGYAHSKEQQPGFGTQRYDEESYTLGFDATWELDLFGHVRRSVEAARGDLGADAAALRGVQVTVAAEVARNYFALRSAQERIKVARENIANQAQTVHLTEVRFDSGRGNELDVQSSRARLEATQATLPVLETSEAAARFRLAVLLGQQPGALDAEFEPRAVPAYAKALPIGAAGGDVGALLQARPDVREAEQRLAAATARVGIATADLFPRVTVTGFVGFLSGDFSHVLSSSSGTDARAWSIAPTVSWSALDFGSVHARLRASRANADGALASYQKTVLTALEECDNAFENYRGQQNRLKRLLDQAQASRRAAELAALQYREGVTDYVTLLDAQRTQLSAESDVAETVGEVNISVVAIYKALGGVGQTDQKPLLVAR